MNQIDEAIYSSCTCDAAAPATWAWTLLAGGGGVWLLLAKGPWPLTNGWFALLSGVAICPLLASFLTVNFAIAYSGRVRLAAAALFFIAGHAALGIERWM